MNNVNDTLTIQLRNVLFFKVRNLRLLFREIGHEFIY